MNNIESRFDIGPSDILFAGVHVCTFQPRNVTGWSSEGVKQSCFQVGKWCGKIRKGSNCKATSFMCMLPASFFVPRTNLCEFWHFVSKAFCTVIFVSF